MSEIKGQILPESDFGKELTKLARNAETIVEIGTWYGQGSTRCLASGLIRPGQRMWTIEQDPAVQSEAKISYSDDRITFICGIALDVLDKLPPSIDLILFDGSDDTTDEEFSALSPRSKYVALDDTLERKNRKQRDWLLASPDWIVLKDDTTERNGWLTARVNTLAALEAMFPD